MNDANQITWHLSCPFPLSVLSFECPEQRFLNILSLPPFYPLLFRKKYHSVPSGGLPSFSEEIEETPNFIQGYYYPPGLFQVPSPKCCPYGKYRLEVLQKFRNTTLETTPTCLVLNGLRFFPSDFWVISGSCLDILLVLHADQSWYPQRTI